MAIICLFIFGLWPFVLIEAFAFFFIASLDKRKMQNKQIINGAARRSWANSWSHEIQFISDISDTISPSLWIVCVCCVPSRHQFDMHKTSEIKIRLCLDTNFVQSNWMRILISRWWVGARAGACVALRVWRIWFWPPRPADSIGFYHIFLLRRPNNFSVCAE